MKSVKQWLNGKDSDQSAPLDAQHPKESLKKDEHSPTSSHNNQPKKQYPHKQSGGNTYKKTSNHSRSRNSGNSHPHTKTNNNSDSHSNSKSKAPLRVYPLGGFEQVGRNCFVVEVDQDIFIIDLGLQFPEEDMLGIDYLIPDISSLKGKEHRIKAILFTHGHLDHIGAVQHLLPDLKYAPCYGTKLTIAMIKKRLDEEKLTSHAKLQPVDYGQQLKFGATTVEFLKVTHSIPDSAAIALHTPYGTLVHTGDFKFDLLPKNEEPADFQSLAALGQKGVLAVIADSTNARIPGHSKSESAIFDTLGGLIDNAKGRIIISTFSSLLSRIQMVIDQAKQHNRKIFVAGRSMVTNIEIAQNLGYLKAPRGMIRKVGPGMNKIPDKELIIITTGSQGEERAGLARIGLGTHRQIEVKRGDTVILSSSPIPGNQRAVSKVLNNLELKGAIVQTNDEFALHTTGHGYQQDILLMHRLLKPKHIIPEHGEPSMRSAHAGLARRLGYADNQIHLIINGEILEFDHQGNARKSKQKLDFKDVIIDGRGSAGEGQRVMNDRTIMSKAGMITVIMKVYSDSKRLVGNPDIISRGLIYGSEEQKITKEVIQRVKKAYEEAISRGDTDRKDLKKAVTGALYRYFDREINREPMVVPIFVEV